MSIIETLTEGMVHRNMKQEGDALLNKWSQTGLLEGISSDQGKHTMARLLENQARELLRESSSMGAGDVEGFAAVAFPIVRRVFAGLIANELVSVQPMSLPSGLIFFLDFEFSSNIGAGNTAGNPRMGNSTEKSIYGTNQSGAEIIDGVDLINSANKAGFGGPGRDGQTGYAYASPSGSQIDAISGNSTALQVATTFLLDGSVSEANKKLIQYDPDLLSATTLGCIVVDVTSAEIESVAGAGDADFKNMSPFQIDPVAVGDGRSAAASAFAAALESGTGYTSGSFAADGMVQIRRLSNFVKSADNQLTGVADAFRFVLVTTDAGAVPTESTAAIGTALPAGFVSFPIIDKLNAGSALGSINTANNNYALEGSSEIPEIDIKVNSTAITAQTKKLKAKWTPELGQDLNAYHNLDAEVELTSILSEQIALEIDREILADLVNGATAGTFYWSRSPGLFVNRVTGAEIGASSAAPDFTGTVSEWYETLIETINDVSAQIHRKTLRGGANFVVCSPEVANILEFTAGFRANVTADVDKGEIGAVKVGSLSRKFDVMVDPYFPRNLVLIGRKGSSFLESGYVYAPYVPLQITPTIFGTEDFVPRKGVMTRYGKKMVRPDMYGLVVVRGLLGEAGSTGAS